MGPSFTILPRRPRKLAVGLWPREAMSTSVSKTHGLYTGGLRNSSDEGQAMS